MSLLQPCFTLWLVLGAQVLWGGLPGAEEVGGWDRVTGLEVKCIL